MVLECKQLFDIPGEKSVLQFALDLSDYELFSFKPFQSPITVNGVVENRAGIVSLNMNCSFVMKLCCDRCLEEFERAFEESFSHILVRELSSEKDNDDYIVVDTDKLDLDDLVLSDILLVLPTKILCKEDCKGLCSVCGKNLNFDSCDCQKKEADPRLSKLSELLK